MRAVYFINERIAPLLIGKDPRKQSEIDELIRKLSKYSNVLYPLSVAVCKAGAKEQGVSVEDYLSEATEQSEQSFILKYFSSSLFEIYLVSDSLQKLAEIPVPREPFESPEEALVAMSDFSVGIGINMNASEFLTEDNHYMPDGEQKLYRDEMIDMYFNWANEFHSLVFIEDPFDQDDVAAFDALKETLKDTQCFVLGTNLYASRAERVRPCADAIALKPSAAGTVTRALETAKRAKENGLTVVVSGRTGDVTSETFEAKFARGISAGYIRQNRMEKFN
jgi:enolase